MVLPGDLPYHGDDQRTGEWCRHADWVGGNDSLDGGSGNDVLYGDLAISMRRFMASMCCMAATAATRWSAMAATISCLGAGADHYEFRRGWPGHHR